MDVDSTSHHSEKSGEHFLIFLIDLTYFDALVVETSMAVDQKIETDLSVMIVETGALFKFKFFRCIFIFVDPLERRPDSGAEVLGHGSSILIVRLFQILMLVRTHILLQISSENPVMIVPLTWR